MGSITKTSRTDKKSGRAVTQYRAYIRRPGVSTSKVFERITDAKRWLADNENSKALVAAATRGKAGTFAALVEAFVRAPSEPGTKFWSASHLDFWKGELGALNVAEIKRGDINAAKAKLQVQKAARYSPAGLKELPETLTPATVNRYLASMSSVLNFALKNSVIDVHPMKAGAVGKLKESAGRKRILTAEEEGKLYAAAEGCRWEPMGLFLRVCLTTGARKSEVLGLRWKDVHLAESVAILTDTKNGSDRAMPLVSDVKAALAVMDAEREANPQASEFVFYDPKHPERPKNIDVTWKLVRERAGLLKDREDRLEQVVLHSTRHTVATKLLKTGANVAQVANITGHKTLSMLSRYTHLAAQDAVDLAQDVFGK